jgi:hypothetical protein
MKELLAKLLELKESERLLKEERYLLEGEIYTQVESMLNDDKTITVHADGYKLSVKPTFSVKVDQEMASTRPDLFKVKYEMSYSQYKKASGVDDYVTINQTKPNFGVELVGV